MDKPEDIIHAAWVERAAHEKERARAAGFAGREMRCEPWMPEVAAKALWDAGWRPPACGCGPSPEDKAFAETAARILNSEGALDALISEFYDDNGDWPEVAS